MDSPLRAARDRLGLTQAQMATRLGVSLNTINRWENNAQVPKPVNIMAPAIAKAYEIGEDDVLHWIADLMVKLGRFQPSPEFVSLEQRVARLEEMLQEHLGSAGATHIDE